MKAIYARQTPALDLCPFVPWTEYDWHKIIQCNPYRNGLKIPWNPAIYCIIAAAHAVAIYMCLELFIRTAKRFRRWNKLYPWSLVAASLGQIGLIITCDLSIWVIKPGNKAWTALNIISSIMWLTGFAFVLYSRLHLIIPREHRRVRIGILVLLIMDTIAFHTPGIAATIIGAYGSQRLAYDISKHAIYIDIGYAGQDILLSSLYIFYFRRYMRDGWSDLPIDIKKELRTMLALLLAAYLVVLISTTLSLVLLGKMLLLARYTMLPLVNVLNLQVEFFVLNRLVQTADLKNQALLRGNVSEVSSLEGGLAHSQEIRTSKIDMSFFVPPTHGAGNVMRNGESEISAGPPCSVDIAALERQYLGCSDLRGG